MATVTAPAVTFRSTVDLIPSLPIGRVVSPYAASFRVDTDLRVVPSAVRSDWRAQLVNQDGSVVSEMPEAELGPITDTLNEPSSCQFTVPVSSDAGARLFAADKIREVRVWRGDQVVFWGPVTRVTLDGDVFTCEAQDPRWYLVRRFVGGPVTNNLTNGNFALGLTGWGWLQGTTDGLGLSLTAAGAANFGTSTDISVPGTRRSALLKNTDGDPNTYVQIYQARDFTAFDYPLTVTFTAYAYIKASDVDYDTTQTRGLYLARLRDDAPSLLNAPFTHSDQVSESPIEIQDWPTDQWVRMSASVTIPPGESRRVHASLFCPDGLTVYWGDAWLHDDYGLEYLDDDQSVIVRSLVDHAQDTSIGKSDVNLTCDGTSAPASGPLRSRRFVFAEHQNVWSAVKELTELDDGVDTRVTYDDQNRWLHVQSPTIGSYRRSARLFYGRRGGNCTVSNWSRDYEQAASRAFALEVAGSPRREGNYTDSDVFNGTTLEVLSFADRETTTSLDSLAQEAVGARQDGETVQLRCLPGSNVHLHGLHVGDHVPVELDLPSTTTGSSAAAKSTDMRVLSKVWQPDSDTATFTLGRSRRG